MEEWLQRVVVERDELEKKIDGLTKFLEGNSGRASVRQQMLMHEQLGYMSDYLSVLNARISSEV